MAYILQETKNINFPLLNIKTNIIESINRVIKDFLMCKKKGIILQVSTKTAPNLVKGVIENFDPIKRGRYSNFFTKKRGVF